MIDQVAKVYESKFSSLTTKEQCFVIVMRSMTIQIQKSCAFSS